MVKMELIRRPRKACDLCYVRRIKCDGQEPRCSNCVNYETQCTHIAISRKSKPRALRHRSNQRVEPLESQQAELQRTDTKFLQTKIDGKHRAIHRAENLSDMTANAQVEDQPADDNHAIGSMELPPLQEAMAVVGIFLNTINSALPLFHADSLLRMVGECYALLPRQRDPVVWAAINVIFTLARQQIPQMSGQDIFNSPMEHTTEYLNKAQSIMSTVMVGEIRLLNIQTLLGMVMVQQTARDPTQSLILMSATMRLVHKLGLHNQAASAHLDLVQRRQHTRVFWIAYVLDKDLSLRTQLPSVQLDEDIDVELPSSLPISTEDNDNTAGIVFTTDGETSINYFLARIQLANIEGRICRYLYSTQASKQSPEEKSIIRHSISVTLDEWRACIPLEFGPAIISVTTMNKPANLGFFCVLHSISLQCMVLINRTQAWDEQWMTAVDKYSKGMGTLQLPPCWEGLLHDARDFMVLFQKVWSKDSWFRWMTSCPYLSAMMLLTVNNLQNVRHEKILLDIELVTSALYWIDRLTEEVSLEPLKRLRGICAEVIRIVDQRRLWY